MSGSRFETHPRITAAAIVVVSIFLTLLVAELGLRWRVSYDPGYYTRTPAKSEKISYPYGIIEYNSLGFADEEFSLDGEEPRVGYIGDSVTFGLGAGSGYRTTDLMKSYYPDYQHMNLGTVGKSIDADQIQATLGYVEDFGLDVVVYLHNLNDILPDARKGERVGASNPLKRFIKVFLDPLRGRLYLYTTARNATKNLMLRWGIGHTGAPAFELFPDRYADVIRQTASRINQLADALRERDVELIVLILPYEMQISREAERVYAESGISWGEEFIALGTQRRLQAGLGGMRVIDLSGAFLDSADPEASRSANGVGEYFVYDRGGRLDWNHPNRAGHCSIAGFLARQVMLGRPRPGVDCASADSRVP